MDVQNASSVKAHSYVPYGRQVDLGYIEQTIDARGFKEKNQRVQVNLSATVTPEDLTTNNRLVYKKFPTQDNSAFDMISNLKSSNIALGFVTGPSGGPEKTESHARSKNLVGSENLERSKMYSYVKDRGYSSNVLPSSLNHAKLANAHVLSENKSTNQATFKWNNFKVAWVK